MLATTTGLRSEFYRFNLTTSVIPIDIAGGASVVIQAQGDNVRIDTSPSQENYFLIADLGAGLNPLIIPSTDQRLYVRADNMMAVLMIWVVR